MTGQDIDDKKAVIAGGDLTYPPPSGTTVTIQVAAYDILGEGGKSEPLQATTTALDEMDIPDWVKEPLENIEGKWVIDTDQDGNISGLVKVDDPEQDGSHIAILVDRFSIATPAGRKQIFAFDTGEQVLFINGDLVAEGLIRATEVQAEVAKHLLLQAELAYLDELTCFICEQTKSMVAQLNPSSVGIHCQTIWLARVALRQTLIQHQC